MTADRDTGPAVDAPIRNRSFWRTISPFRAGFLLALVVVLPLAVRATRTHLVRSVLRDARDGSSFVVFGDDAAVVPVVLRTVRDLVPDAEVTVQVGGFPARPCLQVIAASDDGVERDEREVLRLEDGGRLAIRVSLRGDCVPGWMRKDGVEHPWRACLPGTSWPD